MQLLPLGFAALPNAVRDVEKVYDARVQRVLRTNDEQAFVFDKSLQDLGAVSELTRGHADVRSTALTR